MITKAIKAIKSEAGNLWSIWSVLERKFNTPKIPKARPDFSEGARINDQERHWYQWFPESTECESWEMHWVPSQELQNNYWKELPSARSSLHFNRRSSAYFRSLSLRSRVYKVLTLSPIPWILTFTGKKYSTLHHVILRPVSPNSKLANHIYGDKEMK